jgi:hypothetical protein
LIKWWNVILKRAHEQKNIIGYFNEIMATIPFLTSTYKRLKGIAPSELEPLIETIKLYKKWTLAPTKQTSKNLTELQKQLSQTCRILYERIHEQVSQFNIIEIPHGIETGHLLLDNIAILGTIIKNQPLSFHSKSKALRGERLS